MTSFPSDVKDVVSQHRNQLSPTTKLAEEAVGTGPIADDLVTSVDQSGETKESTQSTTVDSVIVTVLVDLNWEDNKESDAKEKCNRYTRITKIVGPASTELKRQDRRTDHQPPRHPPHPDPRIPRQPSAMCNTSVQSVAGSGKQLSKIQYSSRMATYPRSTVGFGIPWMVSYLLAALTIAILKPTRASNRKRQKTTPIQNASCDPVAKSKT